MGWQEVTIRPCPSGFGEWEVAPDRGEEWVDKDELLRVIRSNYPEVICLNEVDWGNPPKGCEDIRGRIHNEPDEVWFNPDPKSQIYFGLEEWVEICLDCGSGWIEEDHGPHMFFYNTEEKGVL